MSADPVWCLFRIEPSDVLNVSQAFNQAVERSQIAYHLQDYLKIRTEIINQPPFQTLNEANIYFPDCLIQRQQNSDVFDWEDLHQTYHLFFQKELVEIFDTLFVGDTPIISQRMSQSQLELIITNRVCATEMLWGGLGWQRANKLPGYLGNMFVKPENIANVLAIIEEVFAEISNDEFIQGAKSIGFRGNCNEDDAEALQSIILSCFHTVLQEGNGLLALSHPHIGMMPFPENY
ncbi:hypothetical protein H6G74_00065 [Nostoc spongiaeforme FACHB-130]|uniref:Uncharacterized protein n=1 Tax=Nostoc spongiaeforme FACHB-130 TaxID=1357510 RepID=A0ABR8FRA1_9NOSO|nr:hypothetical protein [Nostoc spongiaeforme]MBD2592723.1 hypothetical protein [Nostoc spongiaeforme FACHB-130]